MVVEIIVQMWEFDAKDIGSYKAIVHYTDCIVAQERFIVLLKPKVRVIVCEIPQCKGWFMVHQRNSSEEFLSGVKCLGAYKSISIIVKCYN